MNNFDEQIIALIEKKLEAAKAQQREDISCNCSAVHWDETIHIGEQLLKFFKSGV